MSRDRFAKTFSNGIASSTYYHDDLIAKEMRDAAARMAAVLKAAPPWKRELWSDKAAKTNRSKKSTVDRRRLAAERLEAEGRVTEAVRTAVALLEYHMVELMQYPDGKSKTPNQSAIYNAIVTLKTKCGVSFEGNEFKNKIEMDRQHIADDYRRRTQADDDLDELRQHQREQREAAYRRVAERLKARR